MDLTEMKKKLEEIWDTSNPPKPKPALDVQKVLKELKDGIQNRIVLAKDFGLVKTLFNDLQEISVEIEVEDIKAAQGNSATTYSAECERLRVQLDDLKQFVANLVTLIVDNGQENARAQYASEGQWAMHFSTVRMTITTFFIGISWGVVSVKWDEFSLSLGISALLVWALAGWFLRIFTEATLSKTEKQKNLKNLILTSEQSSKYKELSQDHKDAIRRPWKIFIKVITPGFVILVLAWGVHNPKKHVELTAIVAPSPDTSLSVKNKIEGSSVVFTPVDFSQTVTNMQALLVQLTNIQTAISNLAVSSTNTPHLQAHETGFLIGIGRREIK